MLRDRRSRVGGHRVQSGRGLRRFLLADRAPDFILAVAHQLLGIERRAAGEQLIEQHAKAVDVAARVDIQPTHLRLLRRHVERGADHLLELREEGQIGQPLRLGRFGHTEVNDLRHRHAVVQRDEDVRGLQIAVDDALLMGMLHRLTDRDEEREPLRRREIRLIAVIRDLDAPHQFHDKERPPRGRGARIMHFGDVGMIHHRERLALLLETRDHFLRVHPHLDDLQRHSPTHRLDLFCHPHDAEPTFADLLEELVIADPLAAFFAPRACELAHCRLPLGSPVRLLPLVPCTAASVPGAATSEFGFNFRRDSLVSAFLQESRDAAEFQHPL